MKCTCCMRGNTSSRDCNRINTCLLLHSEKQTSVRMWLIFLFSNSQCKVILNREKSFKNEKATIVLLHLCTQLGITAQRRNYQVRKQHSGFEMWKSKIREQVPSSYRAWGHCSMWVHLWVWLVVFFSFFSRWLAKNFLVRSSLLSAALWSCCHMSLLLMHDWCC